MLVADRILDTIDPTKLYKKYRVIQKEIVKDLQDEYDLPFQCSEALLLAHIKGKDVTLKTFAEKKIIEPFRRGDGYRFCLTPYFKEWVG
jgi:hypothetical protein